MQKTTANFNSVQRYNIVKDKKETTNLNNENFAIANKLKQELNDWWKSLPRLN
jgi:hypothetical protein